MRCPRLLIFALGAIAVLAIVSVTSPPHSLAQQATPTPQPSIIEVSVDGRFPWWDIVGALAAVLGALAAVLVAVAVLYAAFGSVRQYLSQRKRESDLDLAKLQGDLVELLRQKCDATKENPDKNLLRAELEEAQDVYEGILRGIICVLPELMEAAREALAEYLTIATEEMKSLRRSGGS